MKTLLIFSTLFLAGGLCSCHLTLAGDVKSIATSSALGARGRYGFESKVKPDSVDWLRAVEDRLGGQVASIFGISVLDKNLLQAIDLAMGGQGNAAHEMVKRYEADTIAAWIHAILHKIEGDRDNGRYWYRRAGKSEHFSDEPETKLAEIRKEVAGRAESKAAV